MTDNLIQVAMADDHTMIRQALASMVEGFGEFKVILQASNGRELLNSLDPKRLPQLVLLDNRMPELDGIETAKELTRLYPDIKILALSMMDDEQSIIGMIRNGAKGYLLKDAEPAALREAMNDVLYRGFHYSDLVTGRLIHTIQKGGDLTGSQEPKLTERETEFLKLACSELTYKEIANQMHVSPRTVDGYRDVLFEKLGLKSRVGLCLYSMRKGNSI
jgi:DNA-binding NarL/FixJ family response regulator